MVVAAGWIVTTADPNTGSSRNPARSIGLRSSNTTYVSAPRENNAAPTGLGKGTWIAVPVTPSGGRDRIAVRATGPEAMTSRVTGHTACGSGWPAPWVAGRASDSG